MDQINTTARPEKLAYTLTVAMLSSLPICFNVLPILADFGVAMFETIDFLVLGDAHSRPLFNMAFPMSASCPASGTCCTELNSSLGIAKRGFDPPLTSLGRPCAGSSANLLSLLEILKLMAWPE